MLRDYKARLLFHTGIIAGIVGTLSVIVLVLAKDISAQSNHIYDIKADLYKQSRMLSDYMKLKETSQEAEVMLKQLKSALPDKDGLYEAKSAFELMARRRGVAFNSRFGEEKASTATDPGEVELEIIAQGDYNSVVAFLKEFEESRYYLRVTGADISRQGSQTNAVIDAVLFFR